MAFCGGQTSVRRWYSAAELADLGLPGLPSERSRIAHFARDNRWGEKHDRAGEPLSRPRAGRGGGSEYHVTLLPASSILELIRRGLLEASYAPETPASEPVQSDERGVGTWGWYNAQLAQTKAEAERRLKVIQTVDAALSAGLKQAAAVAHAASAHDVSAATVWNWLAVLKGVAIADRLPALAPRRKGGGVKADIHPQVMTYYKSLYLTPEERTYSACYFYTKRWADGLGLTMPHPKTLQRELERTVPREVMVFKRKGAKALTETLPSQTRSRLGMEAMDLINIDGHTFDVWVVDPDTGKPFRPTIIGMQDVASSKILAWRVCHSESIFHTRLCFADLFEKWGLPAHIYMDNGRAFCAKYFTGGVQWRFRGVVKEDEPWGLLPQLGIKNTFATPAHGQAKPIERAFGDLVKFIPKHPFCAGAYTGNSPTNKPDNYGKAAVPWDDFKLLVDEMIAEFNAFEDRRGAHVRGRSFDSVFFESLGRVGKRVATQAQIDMALLEAKVHKLDRKTAEIRLHDNRYYSPALYELAGQDVTIRFDPDNLHKEISVYTTKGAFLCKAEVIQATGFLDTEGAKVTAKRDAEFRKKTRELAELQGLMSSDHLSRMQPRKAPAPAPEAPNVVRAHRTRGIGSGSAAALRVVADAAPRIERVAVIDRFAASMEATEPQQRRRRFSLLDGGLNTETESQNGPDK